MSKGTLRKAFRSVFFYVPEEKAFTNRFYKAVGKKGQKPRAQE